MVGSGESTKLDKLDPFLQGWFAGFKKTVFKTVNNNTKHFGVRVEPEEQGLNISFTTR